MGEKCSSCSKNSRERYVFDYDATAKKDLKNRGHNIAHQFPVHTQNCFVAPVFVHNRKMVLGIECFRESDDPDAIGPEQLREEQRKRFKDVAIVDKVMEADKQWRLCMIAICTIITMLVFDELSCFRSTRRWFALTLSCATGQFKEDALKQVQNTASREVGKKMKVNLGI